MSEQPSTFEQWFASNDCGWANEYDLAEAAWYTAVAVTEAKLEGRGATERDKPARLQSGFEPWRRIVARQQDKLARLEAALEVEALAKVLKDNIRWTDKYMGLRVTAVAQLELVEIDDLAHAIRKAAGLEG